MSLDIHKKVKDKLDFFIKENKIPHIIFYGPSGSGKRTILNGFIQDIYEKDKQKINQYVMYVAEIQTIVAVPPLLCCPIVNRFLIAFSVPNHFLVF